MTAGLADRTEEVVKMAAQELYRKRVETRKAGGKRPFMGEEFDSDAAFGKYLQVRNNVQGWLEILQSSARVKEDGRVLLPNELVEATKEYEARLSEGEE
jgi:hypothetical protein